MSCALHGEGETLEPDEVEGSYWGRLGLDFLDANLQTIICAEVVRWVLMDLIEVWT